MILRELIFGEAAEFYNENPTKYLSDEAGCQLDAEYFGVVSDSEEIIAVTSYVKQTDHLVLMQSTMILPEHRGQGVGRFLNEQLTLHLKELGFGKIVSHVYIDNLPSIILKLKLGYIIEGTLRDHDFIGQHEYIIGKLI